MQFRGYRPGDAEAMFLLDIECFSGAFQFDREMMREAAEDPSAIVVIVEEGPTRMLGFVIVHVEGEGAIRFGYIVTIDVARDARRTGVGSKMLRQAEEQARAAGLHRIGLHVAADNADAIGFYEHEQYKQNGIARGYYRQAGLDALVYAKQL